MSNENKKTIEVYQNGGAKKYLVNTKTHDLLDKEKANKKREKLNNFILDSFSALPKDAKIFEIGCGNGENAKFIQDSGYKITASDVADDFIEATKALGVETVKFNLIEDEFDKQYDGIFCWRVFVHFSLEDFAIALNKIYNALKVGGVFVFNVINRETRNVDNEMVDFDNEYKMGEKRFYQYYKKEQIDSIVAEIGYKIQSFHLEGGSQNNKWLVYALKK